MTHDNRILDAADRIVNLEDGRLVSLATEIAASTGSVQIGQSGKPEHR